MVFKNMDSLLNNFGSAIRKFITNYAVKNEAVALDRVNGFLNTINSGDYYVSGFELIDKWTKYVNNKEIKEENMSFETTKEQVQRLMESDYRNFAKALISIEYGIDDKKYLESVYNEYINDSAATKIFDIANDKYFRERTTEKISDDFTKSEEVPLTEKDKYKQLKYELDDVSYAAYETLKSDPTRNISDMVTEVADSNIEVYSSELIKMLPDLKNQGYYERVSQELGLSGDLDKDIMSAQFLKNIDTINDNINNIATNVIIDKIAEYNLPLTEEIEDIIHSIDVKDESTLDNTLYDIDVDMGYEAQRVAKEILKKEGIKLTPEIESTLEDIEVINLSKDQTLKDLVDEKIQEVKHDIGIENKEISR